MSNNLISLGNLYISDFVKDSSHSEKHELSLILDEDGAARLTKHVPINKMFGKYWYRSGTNESMKRALKDIVDSINQAYKPESNSPIWLDIASNDGTLLSFVDRKYYRIGIDPCEDSFLDEAKQNADWIVQDYFSKEAYDLKPIRGKADVITSIAMFYDVQDRERFLTDLNYVLADNGLWVLQLSYTPLMLNQLAFDNICHEHYYYYSLSNIKKLLERHGFRIMDVQLNTVNGGSFRLYAMKQSADETMFADQPYRDVCQMRIDSLLSYESDKIKPDDKLTWYEFMDKTDDLRHKVRSFIIQEKAKGKSVWGYGASTKGNTLLQYFNLDNSLITAIADRSGYKHGLKTVGTNIPIVSEDEMRRAKPDYLLILPWHFISEFIKREETYLLEGGKFIVPCPQLKIIQKSRDEIRDYVYSMSGETGQNIDDYVNKCAQ